MNSKKDGITLTILHQEINDNAASGLLLHCFILDVFARSFYIESSFVKYNCELGFIIPLYNCLTFNNLFSFGFLNMLPHIAHH